MRKQKPILVKRKSKTHAEGPKTLESTPESAQMGLGKTAWDAQEHVITRPKRMITSPKRVIMHLETHDHKFLDP